MTRFRYRAVDRGGRIVTGDISASGPQQVIDGLTARDLLPLSVARGGGARFGGWISAPVLRAGRRAVLTRELALLLSAGLKLDRALALLQRSAPGAGEALLLTRLLAKVQGGAPFSEALRGEPASFPPHFLAMVAAGEASGSLAAVLERLADQLERTHRLQVQIQGQLIYPALLTVAAVLSVTILLTVVVPAFAPLFAEAGRDLPPITQAMIATAALLRQGGPIGLMAFLAAMLALRRLPPSHALRRGLARATLRLPIVGALLTRLEAARFCRSLGTLLVNGVPLVRSLALARATLVNGALQDSAQRLADGVRDGNPLQRALAAEPLWPPLMAEFCQVGEETGRLGDMTLKLADMFDLQTAQRLDRLVSLLTPVITLLLGLLVAGVLAGVLSTILSVNELAM